MRAGRIISAQLVCSGYVCVWWRGRWAGEYSLFFRSFFFCGNTPYLAIARVDPACVFCVLVCVCAVTTFFVCFAEDPAALTQTHPDTYQKVVAAVQKMHGHSYDQHFQRR